METVIRDETDKIATDPLRHPLYRQSGSHLCRANLDGTQQTILFTYEGLRRGISRPWTRSGGISKGVDEEDRLKEGDSDEIRRANLDGSRVETVAGTQGAYAPMVNPDTDTLSWVIPPPGHKEEVRRTPPDSGRVEILFSVVLGPYRAFRDFAVVGGPIHWATGGELWRARVDGSQQTRRSDRAESPGPDARGVEEFEMDLRGGKPSWVCSLTYEGVQTTEIRRANPDGSQVALPCEGGGERIKGLTLPLSPQRGNLRVNGKARPDEPRTKEEMGQTLRHPLAGRTRHFHDYCGGPGRVSARNGLTVTG